MVSEILKKYDMPTLNYEEIVNRYGETEEMMKKIGIENNTIDEER